MRSFVIKMATGVGVVAASALFAFSLMAIMLLLSDQGDQASFFFHAALFSLLALVAAAASADLATNTP